MPVSFSSILVVDDDPIMLDVLQAFFERHGARTVNRAQSGAEGIQSLDRHDDIDLIVSDLHMPGTDGVEFIELLSARKCRLPLVIVSSASKSTVAGASLLASAHGLNILGSLAKPVDFVELGRLLGLPGTPGAGT